jgi:MOSC domain-containing protein YiiM
MRCRGHTDLMSETASDTMDEIAHEAEMRSARLDASIDHIAAAPSLVGTLELVIARPAKGERLVLASGDLRPGVGLVGDNYLERGSSKPPGGPAHPLAELNVMSARALHAVAGDDRERWALAGDQLIVDFDLSEENCPAGTRLAIGSATIEVTTKPHTGCAKFAARFGIEAARWINSRRDLRLRGLCAVVAEAGTVTVGDTITKL